jgi:hypothetical protein
LVIRHGSLRLALRARALRPPLAVTVGVALGAAAIQGALHLVHVFAMDGRYGELLDADSNRGIFDVLSVVAEATGSLASLALARTRPGGRQRFLALSALLAFVTFDDAVGLHRRSEIDWPLILLPVLACTFLLLWSALDRQESRASVRAGLLLLAISVLLGHAAAPAVSALGWMPGSWPYELKVVVKQGAELAGWVVIGGTLVAAAALPSVGPTNRRVAGPRAATSEWP